MSFATPLHKHLLACGALACIILLTFHSVLLPPAPLVAHDAPLSTALIRARGVHDGKNSVWDTAGYMGVRGRPRLEHSWLSRLGLSLIRPGEIHTLFPPQYANTITFPLCAFLVGVGMYLFLITLGLSPFPAFTGAAALMLSGHFITAVFSGHTGSFYMFFYATFCLWLLTYAIPRRSLIAFLWVGVTGGMMLTSQLDIGAMLALMLAAWALFLIWRTRTTKQWGKLAVGLLLAAALGTAYSAQTIYNLAGLAQEVAGEDTATHDAAQTPEEKWDWATQWSLPKAETLTFMMPGAFGWGHTPDTPYWGNIGRSAQWPRGGFRRFSINTQAMGNVTIALALIALCVATAYAPQKRAIIIFWSVCFALSLLLAWGRYADIAPTSAHGFGPYRLFYWLPKMDTMRNPIKFLYPAMVALATLCAYGMYTLCHLPQTQQKKSPHHSSRSHKKK